MRIDIKMSQKALERKSNKPIMEKKRRARINHCLNQLKALILETDNERSRHSKLEKADILEMTVRYLQTLRAYHVHLQQIHHQLQGSPPPPPPPPMALNTGNLTGQQQSPSPTGNPLQHLQAALSVAAITGQQLHQQQQQLQLNSPSGQSASSSSSTSSALSSPLSLTNHQLSNHQQQQLNHLSSHLSHLNHLNPLAAAHHHHHHHQLQAAQLSPTWRPW